MFYLNSDKRKGSVLVLFETGFKQISWRRDTSSSQIDTRRQFHKEADFIAPYQQNWTKFKRPIRSTSSKMLSFRLGKYGIFLNEFLTYQLPWIFRFKMWHLQKTFKNISNIKSWHLTWNGPYIVHPNLDLVNEPVRPLLFTKSRGRISIVKYEEGSWI